MLSFNCTCSFSLLSVVSSCVQGWITPLLLGPSQCAITRFVVAELSTFPSGSVTVKLGTHYSNDHTHIHIATATATLQHPLPPHAPTHTHPPFPPALKEDWTRERRDTEREKFRRRKLWSGFPMQRVCRPSPRDVSPLPRGNRKITFRMVMITY